MMIPIRSLFWLTAFLLFHCFVSAGRDSDLPGFESIDDSPTKSPTKSPSPAPSRPPSAAPSTSQVPTPIPCQVSSSGTYGFTNISSRIISIQIDFDYELQYEESYGSSTSSLLTGLEAAMGGLIIGVMDEACGAVGMDPSRRLRTLETAISGAGSIVGVSTKPVDEFVEDRDCEELSAPCKVATGGFKVYRMQGNDDDDGDGSQDVVDTEEESADYVTDAGMEQSLRNLIQSSMSSNALSSTIPGITALYYRGPDSFSTTSPLAVSETTIELDKAEDGRFPIFAIVILAVVALVVGMVGVGSLMVKRRNQNNYSLDGDEEVHKGGFFMSIMKCRKDDRTSSSTNYSHEEKVGLNGANNDSSSYWESGWRNITKTYDSSVEVCMERVKSFKRDSERVDSFRRERNEFIAI